MKMLEVTKALVVTDDCDTEDKARCYSLARKGLEFLRAYSDARSYSVYWPVDHFGLEGFVDSVNWALDHISDSTMIKVYSESDKDVSEVEVRLPFTLRNLRAAGRQPRFVRIDSEKVALVLDVAGGIASNRFFGLQGHQPLDASLFDLVPELYSRSAAFRLQHQLVDGDLSFLKEDLLAFALSNLSRI